MRNAAGDSSDMTAADAFSEVAALAKSEAASTASEVKAHGIQAGQSLGNTSSSVFNGLKDVACDGINEVAQVLRSTQQRSAGEGRSLVRELPLEPLANMAEDVATYLKKHSSEELLADLRTASERQPLLMFASVFALGIGVAYTAKQLLLQEGSRGE